MPTTRRVAPADRFLRSFAAHRALAQTTRLEPENTSSHPCALRAERSLLTSATKTTHEHILRSSEPRPPRRRSPVGAALGWRVANHGPSIARRHDRQPGSPRSGPNPARDGVEVGLSRASGSCERLHPSLFLPGHPSSLVDADRVGVPRPSGPRTGPWIDSPRAAFRPDSAKSQAGRASRGAFCHQTASKRLRIDSATARRP